jgi:hypothetical protein
MESDDELAVVPLNPDAAAVNIQRVYRGASLRAALLADPEYKARAAAASEAAAERKQRTAAANQLRTDMQRLATQHAELVKSHEVWLGHGGCVAWVWLEWDFGGRGWRRQY